MQGPAPPNLLGEVTHGALPSIRLSAGNAEAMIGAR